MAYVKYNFFQLNVKLYLIVLSFKLFVCFLTLDNECCELSSLSGKGSFTILEY